MAHTPRHTKKILETQRNHEQNLLSALDLQETSKVPIGSSTYALEAASNDKNVPLFQSQRALLTACARSQTPTTRTPLLNVFDRLGNPIQDGDTSDDDNTDDAGGLTGVKNNKNKNEENEIPGVDDQEEIPGVATLEE